MKKLLLIIAPIAAAVMLSGCAFTPEAVKLNPTVNVKKQNIGHGEPVAVKVIDARKSTSLGGRASGYGPAANITLANNLKKTVTRNVDDTLRAYGFKPVNQPNQSARQLTVRIIALTYNQRAGFFVGGIRVNSTIEATAKSHNATYDKIYRTLNKHGTVLTPTAASDTKHINAALSDTLEKLAQDKKLFRFLAKK